MSENRIQAVFDRFLLGSASPEDLRNLLDYFQSSENAFLKERIRSVLETEELPDAINVHQPAVDRIRTSLIKKRILELQTKEKDSSISEKELTELKNHLDQYRLRQVDKNLSKARSKDFESRNHFLSFRATGRIRLAGVVILLAIIGVLWIQFTDNPPIDKQIWSHEVILPEDNEARIEFGNGESISVLNGDRTLLLKRGIEIVKSSNQEIVFKITSRSDQELSHNTFISPKGTASHVILPDNTHVWLNSNTRLTYPSVFSDARRVVELNGEGYFDVNHDANRPFVVSAAGTEVTVLGTTFNVATNLNQDDVLTTLVSGSVAVSTDQDQALIRPGMQSASNKHSGDIRSYDVEIWNEVAWKSGFFKFDNDNIHEVLDKLSAWYEIRSIEIHRETTDRFSGTLKRTRKLSALLKNLEEISNYKFTIEDGRIIVMI